MKKRALVLGSLMMLGISSMQACEETAIVSGLKPVIQQGVVQEEPIDSIIEFQIYGELAPDDYLSESDTVSLIYGFRIKRLAGCVVTSGLVDSVSKNNLKSALLMKARYGDNWKVLMEEKTGKKITYNR